MSSLTGVRRRQLLLRKPDERLRSARTEGSVPAAPEHRGQTTDHPAGGARRLAGRRQRLERAGRPTPVEQLERQAPGGGAAPAQGTGRRPCRRSPRSAVASDSFTGMGPGDGHIALPRRRTWMERSVRTERSRVVTSSGSMPLARFTIPKAAMNPLHYPQVRVGFRPIRKVRLPMDRPRGRRADSRSSPGNQRRGHSSSRIPAPEARMVRARARTSSSGILRARTSRRMTWSMEGKCFTMSRRRT